MNYDGVPGDVTSEKHTSWINLNSVQFGVGRGIPTPTPGNAKDRESSDTNVSEIVVTKAFDDASTGLFRESLQGTGKTVVIDLCEGTEERVYMKYTLTNTLISGYSVSSGGDRPMESISLNFTKIETEQTTREMSHEDGGSPDRVNYDIALHQLS
jgi:type VI secretion system secreted protein Hcp